MDAHRGAFEYDWRARFGLPLSVVGEAMTWGEALRLTRILASDPSSWVCAAVQGWPYPMSRAEMLAADHFDLAHRAAAGRQRTEPYPRPWTAPTTRRIGGTRIPQSRVRALLAERGPDAA